MKVLFVCWANVGRSQMAAAFYNRFTNTHDADSAGTDVDVSGETLQERRARRGGTFTIDAMAEEGINMAANKRTQITEPMIDNYDKIISMAQPEYTPAWLSESPKYVYWDIADPGGKDLGATIIARDIVKVKVRALQRSEAHHLDG